MKKALGFFAVFLFSVSNLAAVPASKTKPQKAVSKILQGEGVTYGGIAGSGFTLKNLRRTAVGDNKKVERIVIDIGDINGEDLRGLPGYYFAELKKNPSRLVIDFAQMPHVHLEQKQIAERLKGSAAIKNSLMTVDPIDNSLSLTWDLKPATKVRVYQVAGQKSTSKVVVDLITE